MEWHGDPATSEIVLLQAGPSFFAYEPILEALKDAPIPLSHVITAPLTSFLGLSKDLALPGYLEEGGFFDLSFLCHSDSDRRTEYNVSGIPFTQ